MKKNYNLILINVMYVTAYFDIVFQCQVFIFDNWSWRSGLVLKILLLVLKQ